MSHFAQASKISCLEVECEPFSPLNLTSRTPEKSHRTSSLNVFALGRKITCLTIADIQEAIALSCGRGQRITIANYNVHAFNLSFHLPWFHQFLKQSEIAHCDGLGILKALRFLGLEVQNHHRVSYTDLMPELLQQCNDEGWSVFLLGTKPENLERAIVNLEKGYPNAKFSGHHGYFSVHNPVANDGVIQTINAFRPNILIVGMGMPVQESWVQRYRDRLQVNAILVGGAVIDRLAGVVSDCPKWISQHGFEWGYRLLKEPKRLASRYVIGNPAFVLQIILAKLQRLSERDVPVVWSRIVSIEELLAEAPYLNVSSPQKKRIGEYLVELNLLSLEDLELALEEQLHTGERLGSILAHRGLISQDTVDQLVKQLTQINRANPKKAKDYVLGKTVDFLAEQLVILEAESA